MGPGMMGMKGPMGPGGWRVGRGMGRRGEGRGAGGLWPKGAGYLGVAGGRSPADIRPALYIHIQAAAVPNNNITHACNLFKPARTRTGTSTGTPGTHTHARTWRRHEGHRPERHPAQRHQQRPLHAHHRPAAHHGAPAAAAHQHGASASAAPAPPPARALAVHVASSGHVISLHRLPAVLLLIDPPPLLLLLEDPEVLKVQQVQHLA